MHETTMGSAALRRALLLDAGASGAMGVLLFLAAGPLAPLLGLPAALLRWAGIVLLPFALLLLRTATRPLVPGGAVRAIVGANIAWVAASLLLLASGAVAPTTLGTVFVLVQAVAVAAFAALELRGAAGGWRRA